jgi:hypothetical protein
VRLFAALIGLALVAPAAASAETFDVLEPARAEAVASARRQTAAQSVAARAALEQVFASEALRTSAYLRAAVGDPQLREAVLWQNRRAVHTGFDPLRTAAARNPSDRAAKERLVASYLQRYCVKNDTIGFFGPVGWMRVVDEGPALRIAPGARLLKSRAVHFQGWAIDALARTFDARPGLRAWIAPRLLPQVRVDRTLLFIPGREPVALAPAHARLLHACDGRRSARTLARELASTPSAGVSRDAEVYALLEAFEQMGLVIWSLEGALELDAERALRDQLSRIDDRSVRVPSLAALDELESCRAAVGAAQGDLDALDRSLETLDATFTRLTAMSATRSPGETYAARTLIYEDCRRDVTIELGLPFLDRLGPALSLLLESARWCTWEIGRRYRLELGALLDRLVARTGSASVDLSAVLAEGFAFESKGEMPAPIGSVHAELRRRWMSVLDVPLDEPQVRYRSADLRARVSAAFEAAAPGWTWARHVSPDVMIAADGADAIERGDYLIVLGELHLTNTLLQTALVTEHPDRSEIQRALDADFPAPTAVPVPSRDIFTARTAIGLWPSRTFWYEASREVAPGPRDRVLRTADLVVTSDADGLWVCARDGRARFDAIDFFGYFLTCKCATAFGLMPDAPHMPRVTIDEVVVARERWQAPAASFEWAWAPKPLERFVGARRWRQTQRAPRFMFVKAPVERKPCYMDFDSPVYVDAFAKLVRRSAAGANPAAPITISEMLPTMDQLWLVDAEGRRYTSELRLAAVDPRGPGGPQPQDRGGQP